MNLYHFASRQKKEKYGPFDIKVAVAFVRGLSPDAIKDIYGWKKGLKGWIALTDFEEFASVIAELLEAIEEPPVFDISETDGELLSVNGPPLNTVLTLVPGPSVHEAVETKIKSKVAGQTGLHLPNPPKKTEPLRTPRSDVTGITRTAVPQTKTNIPSPKSPLPPPKTAVAKATPKQERRKNPRVEIALKIIISNGKETLLTSTTDISLSGMRVSKKVPQGFFQGELDVIMEHPSLKTRLKLRCEIIPDGENPCRFYFKNLSAGKAETLSQWLDKTSQANVA